MDLNASTVDLIDMDVAGFINGYTFGRIVGWACDRSSLAPVEVELLIDGDAVARVMPDLTRPDLAAQGRLIACGLSVPVPARLRDDRAHRVDLREAATGRIIATAEPLSFSSPEEETVLAWKRQVLRPGLWGLDGIAATLEQYEGTAWVVPPHGLPHEIRIALNGIAAELQGLGPVPDELLDQLGLGATATRPAASSARHFRFTAPKTAVDGAAPGSPLQIMVGDRRRPAFDPYATVFVPQEPMPMPPADLRRRVQGDTGEAAFDIIGCTTAHALDRAMSEHAGRRLSDFRSVLDWGCGCGRTARFVLPMLTGAFTGADPDGEAIAWCRAGLPAGRFEATALNPPLPFADATFDLLYGISVFTHLREPDQFRWLEELRRVLEPGGIAVLSVMGAMGWLLGNRGSDAFVAWQREGFFDFGPSTEIGAALGDPDYYRGVTHTADYLHRTWTRCFDILGIIEGAVGGRQDLVVLRRPS